MPRPGAASWAHNADRIHPEWQVVAVGDTLFGTPSGWLGFDRRFGWRVRRADPGEVIVLENWEAFVLRPIDAESTRLTIRTRGAAERRPTDVVLASLGLLLFELPHFVMERKMLLTIKQRAEST
jgi:hypothetical protein